MSEEPITNIDEWISSLYKEDNEFVIEYAGKKLKFQKRFATGLACRLQNKNTEEQMSILISILSVEPHFTPAQAAMLPQDLITKVTVNLDIDPEILKKKSLV
jgi:hypothetical protein